MGISSHRLPSGGAVRGRLPPSGDRWLRATGGYGRQVATGDWWLRAMMSIGIER